MADSPTYLNLSHREGLGTDGNGLHARQPHELIHLRSTEHTATVTVYYTCYGFTTMEQPLGPA